MLNWLKSDKIDHPLANPKDARKIVDDFPVRDAWQTLEDAGHWIDSVNETPEFKLEQRFATLDMLDLGSRRCQEQQLEAYLKLPETDRAQERRLWRTNHEYWSRLARGYVLSVVQATEPRAYTSAFKPQLPLLICRALRALRYELCWVLKCYSALRNNFWPDVAACLRLAESLDTVETPVENYNGVHTSPRAELLRVLVFWASSPTSLSPAEQTLADRIIVALTPKFRYDKAPWEGCDFCFDLESGMSPLRLVRSTPVSGMTRYFDTSEGLKALRENLRLISTTGNIPRVMELAVTTDIVMVVRVIRHLSVNWAKELPSRVHERRRTAMRLNIVHGYDQVLQVIDPASGGELDFSAPGPAVTPDVWIAEDVATGGYGVVAPKGRGDWLRVGLLLALRAETESRWSLGIIRRVKGDEHRQRRIGIQLISRLPLPVMLRSIGGGTGRRQSALLLAARASAQGSMHVLAARDQYTGRETLEAVFGNPAQSAVFENGAPVESGYDFDWMRFKLAPAGV